MSLKNVSTGESVDEAVFHCGCGYVDLYKVTKLRSTNFKKIHVKSNRIQIRLRVSLTVYYQCHFSGFNKKWFYQMFLLGVAG